MRKPFFVARDCTDPYAATAYAYPTEVLAVVAGKTLPVQLEVVAVGGDDFHGVLPEKGETWLLALQEIQGECILWIPLKICLEETTSQCREWLPHEFEAFSEEAMEALGALQVHCPPHNRSLSETIVLRYFDPYHRGCAPR